MARRTPIQKLVLALRLLVGLRHGYLRDALAPAGLTERTVKNGWRLFVTAAQAHSSPEKPVAGPAPDDSLTAFQLRWFPLARIALRAELGASNAERLFHSLAVERKGRATIAVSNFVSRLRAFEESGDELERKAREVLQARGLTEDALAAAERLLEQGGALVEGPNRSYGPVDGPELEALWRWCAEWHGYVRQYVSNKTLLLSLGLEEPAGRKASLKLAPVSIRVIQRANAELAPALLESASEKEPRANRF